MLCCIKITNWDWNCHCSNRYIRCLSLEEFAIDENDIDICIETNMFRFDDEWQCCRNTNVFSFSKFIIDVNVLIKIDVWEYDRKKFCERLLNIFATRNEICDRLSDKIDNIDYCERILDNLDKERFFQIWFCDQNICWRVDFDFFEKFNDYVCQTLHWQRKIFTIDCTKLTNMLMQLVVERESFITFATMRMFWDWNFRRDEIDNVILIIRFVV